MAAYDVTALGTALEFDTVNALATSMVKLPGLDRIVIFWAQGSGVKLIQAFNVNTSTGAITAIGSSVNVATGTGGSNVSMGVIDASNVIVFWEGADGDGFCQLYSLDGTGNLSANGSAVEFHTADARNFTNVIQMDATHYLFAWQDMASEDGFAQIFTVNTGTGTITPTGSPFEFETSFYERGWMAKLSSTKVVIFYNGLLDDGFCVVLNINTSTWAVSAAGAKFEYLNNATIAANCVVGMDTAGSPIRVINGFVEDTSEDSFAQSFSINTSTWEITAFGSALKLADYTYTGTPLRSIQVQKVDDTHVLCWYIGTSGDGFARVLTFNTSTGELTTTANEIEFDTADFDFADSVAWETKAGFYVCCWSGSGNDGFVQAFQVTPATSIKTWNGIARANLKTLDGTASANIKTIIGVA